MSSASVQSRGSAAVTGAGSGLGRDIALGLAAMNYRVFGTALSAEEVADLKQASNGAVTLTVCDMTDEAAVKSWAREVESRTEGLDLLINNAGILTPGPLEALLLGAIRREFEVNVFGALSVINAFLPALRKTRGRIVQVSTWTGMESWRTRSKAARSSSGSKRSRSGRASRARPLRSSATIRPKLTNASFRVIRFTWSTWPRPWSRN